MKRNPSSFSNHIYDVLIVGGGINGSACALESARRGFKTLLIDKTDFGASTSSGCFKIVHGGLRYLQHLDIVRLRESLKEQTAMRRMAPHLVKPLPFLVPTYSTLAKSKPFLACGMALYEALSFDKNFGFAPERKLPMFASLSKQQCLSVAPHLREQGLTGGLVFHDAQMTHCDRLTFAFAQTAKREGADICNYIELVSARRVDDEKGTLLHYEAELNDTQNREKHTVRARSVVNAAGPWSSKVVDIFRNESEATSKRKLFFSKGIQVILPQLVSKYGLAIESGSRDPKAIVARGGRSYFMHPWRGMTLLGTSDSLSDGEPSKFSISKSEVQSLLKSVKAIYKEPQLKIENVKGVFGGLRPLAKQVDTSQEMNDDSKVSMHPEIFTPAGLDNVVTVVGVKYTTCRLVAEKTLAMLCKAAKLNGRPAKTSELELVGAASFEEVSQQIPSELLDSASVLYETYGSALPDIVEGAKRTLEDQGSSLEDSLADSEIRYVIENELAVELEDVFMRRTSLGQTGVPKESHVAIASKYLAEQNGWSEKVKQQREVRLLEAFSMRD